MANPTLPALEAVLFDVDGTLVDSNALHARAWADALVEHGYPRPLEEIRRLIGMGGDRIMPLLVGVDAESKLGTAIDERRQEIFRTRYLPEVRGIPGAPGLVRTLRRRGLRVGIASSADEETLRRLLEIGGVPELVEKAASSSDVERSKPSPDIVHAALERLRVDASAALLVGDTPYDVAAARRAGVAFVGVLSGGWSDAALVGSLAIYDDVAEMLVRLDDPTLAHLFGRPRDGAGASAAPAGA